MNLSDILRIKHWSPWSRISTLARFTPNFPWLKTQTRPCFFSSSHALDTFSQMANWLVLASSEFNQFGGALLAVDGLTMVSWLEKPELLTAELNILSVEATVFSCRARIRVNDLIVSEVKQIVMSLEKGSPGEDYSRLTQQWKCLQWLTQQPFRESDEISETISY